MRNVFICKYFADVNSGSAIYEDLINLCADQSIAVRIRGPECTVHVQILIDDLEGQVRTVTREAKPLDQHRV